MRKHLKLISLILVLAMLCSALAIFVGATEQQPETVSEEFTPTATWEDSTGATEVIDSNDKNLITSISLANWDEGKAIKSYLITEKNGYKYGSLVAVADKTTANHFVNLGLTSTEIVDGGYLVIELDLATESSWVERFSVGTVVRTDVSDSSTDLGCSTEISSFLGEEYADGSWHRYTVICQFSGTTPVSHVFVDGEYAGSQNGFSEKYKADATYYFSGIRLNFPGSADMTPGSSISYNNINTFVVGANESYAKAITNKTLAGTDLSSAPKQEKLTDLAVINGENTNSAAELKAALNGYKSCEVELLRQFAGPISVNANAVVETNGYGDLLVAAKDVGVDANGTEITYTASQLSSEIRTPFTSKETAMLLSSTNAKYSSQLVKNAATLTSTNDGTSITKSIQNYAIYSHADGNTFLQWVVGEDFSQANAHVQLNWNDNGKLEYKAGDFVVIDIDVYAENEFIPDLYFNITSRDSDGSNKGGTQIHFSKCALVTDSWQHVTIIADYDTNTVYVYVNNVRVYSSSGGLYSPSDKGGHYFEGLRLNFNGESASFNKLKAGQNVAFDNVSINLVNKDDSDYYKALTEVYTTASLNDWTGAAYGEDYTMPVTPPAAVINGVEYANAAAASAALLGNEHKEVAILRDFPGTLTVTCNAVINTYGYDVSIAYGKDVTHEQNGNIITTTAPFMKSSSSYSTEDNGTIINTVKANIAGNLFYQIQNNVKAENNMGADIVTNNFTGNSYLDVYALGAIDNDPNDGNGVNHNAYFELQSMTQITPNDYTQYYVYDMDFALLNDNNVPVTIVPRVNGATALWGANHATMNSILSGYELGALQHVTLVFDIDANVEYIFVNGVLVLTDDTGYCTAADHANNWMKETMVRFDGIRLGVSSNSDYIVDNVAIRYVEEGADDASASSLTAAVNAKKLSKWSQSITESTTVAPLASVNGELCYSVATLNKLLTYRTAKSIELLDDIEGTIVINCDATVNTNGVKATVTAGNSVEIVSSEGNVTVYNAPFMPSSVEESIQPADSKFIIDGSVSGNILNGNSSKPALANANGELELYKVTDMTTGNTFLKVLSHANETSANAYLSFEIVPSQSSATAAPVASTANGYYVLDLDVATEGEFINKITIYPVARNQASEGSTFPFGTPVTVTDVASAENGWTHLTIVGRYSDNTQYVFVNGELYGQYGRAIDRDDMLNFEHLTIKGFRINPSPANAMGEGQTLLIDNVSERVYHDATELDEAIASGTLSAWDGNAYVEGAVTMPAIAVIDGVPQSTLSAITDALSDESAEHEVEFIKQISDKLTVNATATVILNGLDIDLVTDSKQLDLGDAICAGSIAILASEDGDTLRYIKLNSTNAADYCTTTYWYSTLEGFEEVEEVIYFPYGMQISYIGTDIRHPVFEHENYIEGGLLYYCQWLEGENMTPLQSLPVANESLKTAFYTVDITTKEVDFNIKNPKVNLSLHESFGINMYVPAATVGAIDNLINIDGVDYVKYTKELSVTEIVGEHTFEFNYEHEGEHYVEFITVDFLEYVLEILDSDSEADVMKQVIVTALNYANSAYALLTDGANENLTALLDTYAKYLPEDTADYSVGKDVSALKGIVKGVQLSLENETAYVINLAEGYTGAITVSYLNFAGETVTETFAAGEAVKINVSAFDLAGGITITAGEASASYDIVTYVNGLESKGTVADFAKALNLYSKAALAYQTEISKVAP